MATEWKWRLFLFVRAVDATAANRQTLAEIFANNASGEDIASESKLFDGVVRLSTDGQEPAQVYGLNTAVKVAMRSALETFLNTLTESRWYAVAAIDLASFGEGDLIASNGGSGVIGQPWGWDDALNDLLSERGLQVIEVLT